jgi:phosphorylcholine metabolism protein LicD
MNHLRDANEILTSEGVDYCLMFGTLLGLLRHDDFIPWDDDLDIIIFDMNKFEKQCIEKFEARGYTVLQDIRRISRFRIAPFLKVKTRCGYRIYSKNGNNIPAVCWKFPWLGVWEHVLNKNAMTLPPEKFIYNINDFFPLQRRPFKGFSVMIPKNPKKILNEYFGAEDWMEYCIPSTLDHRQYKPTGFPTIKKPLKEVMAYLNN